MGCTPSTEKQGAILQCPNTHALKTKRRPDNNNKYCTLCHAAILESYSGCDTCDYNVCKPCTVRAR